MRRSIVFSSLAILIGLVALVFWQRYNRYEILAYSDLAKFAESGSDELYAFYPHLIDKIAENPELARRVVVVHLFGNAEFTGRDFSSLAQLPNLKAVECMYARNVDILVPTLNQIVTLDDLRLYYCEPVDQILQHLHSDSLRSMQVHTYSTLDIPKEVTDVFAQRMPKCMITSTVD